MSGQRSPNKKSLLTAAVLGLFGGLLLSIPLSRSLIPTTELPKLTTISNPYGLTLWQSRSSRDRICRFWPAERFAVRIVFFIVAAAWYRGTVPICWNPDAEQPTIWCTQFPVDETVSVSWMTHARSVHADTSIITRQVLLVCRIPRTHWNGAV